MEIDALKPINDAKKSLDRVIKLTFEESTDKLQLKKTWNEVVNIFSSDDFEKYREVYAKLSLMIPSMVGKKSEKPMENSYFKVLVEMLEQYDRANYLAHNGRIDSVNFKIHVGAIKTYLNIMKDNHELLDNAMKH